MKRPGSAKWPGSRVEVVGVMNSPIAPKRNPTAKQGMRSFQKTCREDAI
jgi:hypothetical protein